MRWWQHQTSKVELHAQRTSTSPCILIEGRRHIYSHTARNIGFCKVAVYLLSSQPYTRRKNKAK
ncbi:rCG31414, isoform CRA_b [Rattus norvegicus]|uniref:RCG31414, isoform CRA_b n=1 Tax=Rattus norvegicus TaxID=10116 RepID=A6ISW8_RAT|nr:rCG31414, isoform CRA_b [Rattus norvegicus]